jgi:hypothetical protein
MVPITSPPMNREMQIERLIRISKEKPLLPESFIPWETPPAPTDIFLPEGLVSLAGLPEYEALTNQQKQDLACHEVVQVMYSYAWSEGLFCLFMNRYILDLSTQDLEYKFLLRELIEEFRHQEMFSMVIGHLGGDPIRPTWIHNLVGKFTVRFMPADMVFLSGIAVEYMADVYGDHIRKDPAVYCVLRKVSDLHNIEEARHILFTKMLLRRYTANAGFLRRTFYSYVVLLNLYFMRTLYVKPQIFERIGVTDPHGMCRKARRHFQQKFGETCMRDIVGFVNEWNGFNWMTRWAWRTLMKAKV